MPERRWPAVALGALLALGPLPSVAQEAPAVPTPPGQPGRDMGKQLDGFAKGFQELIKQGTEHAIKEGLNEAAKQPGGPGTVPFPTDPKKKLQVPDFGRGPLTAGPGCDLNLEAYEKSMRAKVVAHYAQPPGQTQPAQANVDIGLDGRVIRTWYDKGSPDARFHAAVAEAIHAAAPFDPIPPCFTEPHLRRGFRFPADPASQAPAPGPAPVLRESTGTP